MQAKTLPTSGDMPAEVAAWLKAFEPGEARLGVALSGGADSTYALAEILKQVSPSRVIAIHYHHGVRGQAADEDLNHCLILTEKLGVRLRSEKRPPSNQISEQALRDHRLDFFRRVAAEEKLEGIILGHHADDVAETLLMRLARGSGSGGLAAPRPVSTLCPGTILLRPLLLIRKREIEHRLAAAGIPWRHDESNDSVDFATRNRIRHKVAPAWEAAAPGDAVAGALRTRKLLQEDDEALSALAQSHLARMANADSPHLLFWEAGPKPAPAILRRLLRKVLAGYAPGFQPESRAFDGLLAAVVAETPHALSLGKAGKLESRAESLRFIPTAPPVATRAAALLPAPGAVYWPDGACVTAGLSDFKETTSDSNTHAVRIHCASAFLFCAPRALGQKYRPLGLSGSQKISEAMINRKIPAALRDSLPVVSEGDDVIWVPGLLPSEKYKGGSGENRALRLTWTPPRAACLTSPET